MKTPLNATPISADAKVATAQTVWAPVSTKPTIDRASCLVLVQWFDVAEVFETFADWFADSPSGSGCSYFQFFLFNDEHQAPCEKTNDGVQILGWRYR